MRKVWLSSPHMGGAEMEFVKDAFDSNWIAPLGPHVDGFEHDLAAFLGGNVHVAALSSGTAALHLALILAGIKQGDEVICQSFTFSASANPIVYQGAVPVFVDSEEASWNMSPEFLESAIEERLKKGKKTKAIIVVHLYGMPASMKEILEIASRYQIPVIEDAAEALGSKYYENNAGTMGQYGILSFNGNKIITTSGGGALVCTDAKAVQEAQFLAAQARDPAAHYEHSRIGYNYRMSNVCAGIGRGQMLVLTERIRQRRLNFHQYVEGLQQVPGISFLKEPRSCFSNRWLTSILIDPEKAGMTGEDIRLALAQQNIEARPLWKPMHLQPVFTEFPYYGNHVSDGLFEKGLCLPSGSNLSHEDIERVISVIRGLPQ